MSTVKFVYSRYGKRDVFEEESAQEGIHAAQYSNESGEAYAIGVYDATNNTAYLPKILPLGVPSDFREHRLDDIRELCGLKEDHEFDGVKYFDNFPTYA